MTINDQVLGKIDCKGVTRSHPTAPGNTDQFVIAEVRPSLQVRESSLSSSDPSRVDGGTHGLLLVVADGVGDRRSGERASTVAIDALSRYLVNSFDVRHELTPERENQMLDDLKQSLLKCREQMDREVSASDRFESMNTTITLAYVIWPRAYIVHVGNSRAYHATNGQVTRLTSDHTMTQCLKQAGVLGPNNTSKSHMNSVLWNVLGTTGTDCVPESCTVDLKIGDAIVLCTDGVSMRCNDRDVSEAIRKEKTAIATCERILPNHGEQTDDATIVVARFREIEKQEVDRAIEESEIPAEPEVKKITEILHADS